MSNIKLSPTTLWKWKSHVMILDVKIHELFQLLITISYSSLGVQYVSWSWRSILINSYKHEKLEFSLVKK